jgi:hypothetical protein
VVKAKKSVQADRPVKPEKTKADKHRRGSDHPQAELRLHLIDDLPGPAR